MSRTHRKGGKLFRSPKTTATKKAENFALEELKPYAVSNRLVKRSSKWSKDLPSEHDDVRNASYWEVWRKPNDYD
jgi:hypothetical protein